MQKERTRSYSRQTKTAATLLGKHIRARRIERELTAQDLADRVGISRTTLQKIENGDLKTEIGIVFELATIVGFKLFGTDASGLATQNALIDEKLSLLPKAVRTSSREVDDDF